MRSTVSLVPGCDAPVKARSSGFTAVYQKEKKIEIEIIRLEGKWLEISQNKRKFAFKVLTWVTVRIIPVYADSNIILMVNIDAYPTKLQNTGFSTEMSSTTDFIVADLVIFQTTRFL